MSNAYRNVKRFVFDTLDKSEDNGLHEKIFDVFIVALIVLNVVAVVAEPSVHDQRALRILGDFEVFSVVVFTIEYLLRLWVADLERPALPGWKARILYPLRGMALVDLASILPFYLPLLLPIDLRVLRIVRIFRLLRIFKANRYTTAMSTVLKVLRSKAEQLLSSLFIVASLMVIAAVMMFNIENVAQPDRFTSVFDAMWWSVATLTTVGYGDIYPVTVIGKVLAGIIAVLGIGIVSIPTGIIASGFTEIIQKEKHESKRCPHCGEVIDE